MIDFDNVDDWAPKLSDALYKIVPNSVEKEIAEADFKYFEDALDLLFELTDKEAIINKTLDWLSSAKIIFYHGTRLTDSEKLSVLSNGLLPLKAENRKNRIIEALSSHPNWSNVLPLFDDVIQKHGTGKRGKREGQVHLTLSKINLIEGFNYYLIYGSEFDQNVAYDLLRKEGKGLLKQYGKSRIITVVVPGDLALKAAHPNINISFLRERGNIPNLVKEFLQTWSHKLANPSWQMENWSVDCGLMFYKTVSPDWIISIDSLNDDEIKKS